MNTTSIPHAEVQTGYASDHDHENIVRIIHRRLRGHYALGIVAGVILGAAGAWLGYNRTEPQYTAEGLVHVAAELPKLISRIDENEMPPLFDAVVDSEAAYLGSRRVLESAASAPELQTAGWPSGPAGVAALLRCIRVDRRRGSQIITIRGTHTNPLLAQKSVNAVLTVYEELYTNEQRQTMGDKERELLTRIDEIEREIGTVESQIQEATESLGVTDPERWEQIKSDEFFAREAMINEYKLALERLSQVQDASDAAMTLMADMDEQSLALYDNDLFSLLTDRRQVTARLATLRERYGGSHLQVSRLEDQIAEIEMQIEERLAIVRSMVESGEITVASPLASAFTEDELNRLIADQEVLKADLKELGRVQLKLRSLNGQLARLEGDRDRTSDSLNDYRTERPFIQRGRINATKALLPVQASSDRRYQFAAVGAMGGFGLPFALLWGLSIVRPTLRYVDDLDQAHLMAPVLGTLPNLSKPDGDDRELATLSVHHIRNMLRLTADHSEKQCTVYGITSAGSRDGKTSLLIALGASFAAERLRTLIVDADFVGRGLSAAFQRPDHPGLVDAIMDPGQSINIEKTDISNLSLLTAGHVNGMRPEELSREDIELVLNRLRNHYDVILIDTGPLSGSIEANIISSVADEMVLAVPRGQNPRLVNATLHRIHRLRGRCAGIVFNRAKISDVRHGSSQFSFTSQALRSSQAASRTPQTAREPRLLVSAMLEQTGNSSN